jgi:hypothetical protein
MMARIFKIAGWTAGMAIATSLILDGKTQSANWREHLLWGAGIGLFLGYLFSRNLKMAAS